MHITSLPLVFSSLTFLIPYFAAIETGNYITAVCMGALTTTSTILHITKRPYHIHGRGNCFPGLLMLDTLVLNISGIRSLVDGWNGGLPGICMTIITLSYAMFMFYLGEYYGKFVYDKYLDMSILSHMSVHLLASIGNTGIIYLRALKNGP
jgi:hypothetical protein